AVAAGKDRLLDRRRTREVDRRRRAVGGRSRKTPTHRRPPGIRRRSSDDAVVNSGLAPFPVFLGKRRFPVFFLESPLSPEAEERRLNSSCRRRASSINRANSASPRRLLSSGSLVKYG